MVGFNKSLHDFVNDKYEFNILFILFIIWRFLPMRFLIWCPIIEVWIWTKIIFKFTFISRFFILLKICWMSWLCVPVSRLLYLYRYINFVLVDNFFERLQTFYLILNWLRYFQYLVLQILSFDFKILQMIRNLDCICFNLILRFRLFQANIVNPFCQTFIIRNQRITINFFIISKKYFNKFMLLKIKSIP